MTTVSSESQKLFQENKIKLLTITYDDGVLRFACGGVNPNDTITFDGNTYFPRSFKVTGLSSSGGKLPRANLVIDNVDKFFYFYIANYNQMLGLSVNYIELYRESLDDGSDPNSAELLSDYDFIIFQMQSIDKQNAEFTLATNMDLEQVKYGRPANRRGCRREYRSPDTSNTGVFFTSDATNACPYAGSNYFKKDGTSTADWREDDCGGDISDCKLRFGEDAVLPIQVYPGIGQQQR